MYVLYHKWHMAEDDLGGHGEFLAWAILAYTGIVKNLKNKTQLL